MEVYVVHYLMCQSAIVLQNVVVLRTNSRCQLLHYWEYFAQLVVRDVCELRAVMLWDDECMSLAQRLDIEESKDLVGFEQLEGRNVAFDDLAEDTSRRHLGRYSLVQRYSEGSLMDAVEAVNRAGDEGAGLA